MDRLTTSIVAVTTVLAWSMATHFLPPTWWGVAATMAVGVVFAYPLRGALGMTTARYIVFGALFVVLAPGVHAVLPVEPTARAWGTAVILVFALAGLAVGSVRRNRRRA
jgi:hypothetical protein